MGQNGIYIYRNDLNYGAVSQVRTVNINKRSPDKK